MKKTLRATALLAVIFITNLLLAQQTDWCRSDKRLRERITSNPVEAAKWDAFVAQSRNLQSSSRAVNETIYIPVVFHIVYDNDAIGSGENITDAQCLSQIDALNRIYNFQDPDRVNVPSYFQSLVANCNVHFCIAQFDPSGNPTTGIVRHAYPGVATWDTESDIDNTLKPATGWNSSHYLNIWSVRMGGQLTTDGILAYSSFPPPFGAADQDGIVARYTNIGTTSNVPSTYRKGKTVVHEAGHWLGLLHTWGFDASCGDAGDYIDDTPDQADANYGCPGPIHISCNNGPNGDMFMNYMDYADDNCSDMFTIDQAARMHSTLDNGRVSIKTSGSVCFLNLDAAVLKVVLPADTICSLSFRPIVTIQNKGLTTITSGKFYFQIDGGSVQIVNWSGSLETQEQVQVTLPQQTTTAGTHTFDVTFGNVNAQASDGFSGNDNLSVSFVAYDGGTGASAPFAQDFEVAFPPLNWNIYNPNNDNVSWLWNLAYGGYALSNSCVSINNLAYPSNPAGKKDALITEAYDFSNIAYPELRFDVAYARFSAIRTDSLNVYYSFDCGSNWTKLWNQSGVQLATAPNQTTLFAPDPSQWKTVSVPLTFIGAQNKVSFKFEDVSYWGNAMYLDNINVQNNTALSVNEVQKQEIKVFPNPASKLVAVRLPAGHAFQQMQLLNTLGQVVYQAPVFDNSIIFSVEDYTNGLYLIHFIGKTSTQTERLLISK
jgi:hypothetical protein